MARKRSFRPGQMVEVRSLEEILATLDTDGKLDGLPFMPEMAQFCGRRFAFDRTANRTCEESTGDIRRLDDAVFLEGLRCDGSAHDGCQRGCLIFWKTAWLKVPGAPPAPLPAESTSPIAMDSDLKTKDGDRYQCQSTELASATSPLSRWDLKPILGDLRNGEITGWMFLRTMSLTFYNKLVQLFGGEGLYRLRGEGRQAPRSNLGLKTGDCVIVKEREEIMASVNKEGYNRGLSFEYDQIPHCGGTYEVAYPIRKIILEGTGRMIEMTNTVVLEGVVCEGRLRRYCPRQNLLYWREDWLQRCPGAEEKESDESSAE